MASTANLKEILSTLNREWERQVYDLRIAPSDPKVLVIDLEITRIEKEIWKAIKSAA